MRLIEIKEEGLLIIPKILKKKVLKRFDELEYLIPLKIITKDEFVKKMTFTYDERALLYLCDKYDYEASICKILLENMRYVSHDNYNGTKLNDLYALKKELFDKNLIKEDKLFQKSVVGKRIYLYGFDKLDNFLKKILQGYNYEVIDDFDNEYSLPVVHEAQTLEEEVDFVFNQIGQLITDGVAINKIKIVNYSDKYSNVFHKLAKFYNLVIEDKGFSLMGTEIAQDYLYNLNLTKSFVETMAIIKEKYNDNSEIALKNINSLLNISNKYNSYLEEFSFNRIISFVQMEMKSTKVIINNYRDKIELLDLNYNLFDDDDYVFLIGFNQNELPKLYKDEDYLEDTLKCELGLETSSVRNKNEREKVLAFVKHVKNLVISYPLKHLSNNYYPSSMISENGFGVEPCTLSKKNYSMIYAKIKLTNYLDDFIKYGTVNPNLSLYYSNYKIDYLTYDNKFSGINVNKLIKRLNNKLILSYSAINNYNKCHFRYYLDNILKINKYEETFQIKVGNLFHYLLSICFKDNFDLDKEWEQYVSNLNLNDKEMVLLIKLKEEFILIIQFVRNLHQETFLTNCLMEHKIYIDKSVTGMAVSFMGVIDKLMYREKDGETLVSIIDYKTGNPDISLTKVAYGIDMQLPLYWYLVKMGNLVEKPAFVGFYLEKILHGELKRDNKKAYQDVKLDNLKLVGYSTVDKLRLERFDPTYENSKIIRGMKVKQDGEFMYYTKTLDDDILDKLVQFIDKIIEKNRDDILAGKFEINPKQIGLELVGCNYCKYKDICYRRNEDIVKLEEYRDLVFLGGDINA